MFGDLVHLPGILCEQANTVLIIQPSPSESLSGSSSSPSFSKPANTLTPFPSECPNGTSWSGWPRIAPNPSVAPSSASLFALSIATLARFMASSSAFLMVPDTLTTCITHGLGNACFEVFGSSVMKEIAAQTRRKWAREHRMIAVDVAGDRYFTVVGSYWLACDWTRNLLLLVFIPLRPPDVNPTP